MQSGEFIPDRMLPDAVRAACQEQGIKLDSFCADWILRLSKAGKMAWIFGYKFDMNASVASHVAQDKVATYAILAAADVAAVPHVLVRASLTESIGKGIERQFAGREVVLKPLSGTSGRNVARYATVQQAIAKVRTSQEPAWALSPYLDIVSEERYVLLDGELLLAYRKTEPSVEHGLAFYNLSHGARAVDIPADDIDPQQLGLARQAMYSIDLRLGAVDIVTTANGEKLVLEINDGFSMEHYSLQSPEYKKRAAELYADLVARMFT